MEGNDQKIVDFEKYCPRCEHWSKSESEDPCWECLDTPTNTWSHKPVNFKEKEVKNNAKKFHKLTKTRKS